MAQHRVHGWAPAASVRPGRRSARAAALSASPSVLAARPGVAQCGGSPQRLPVPCERSNPPVFLRRASAAGWVADPPDGPSRSIHKFAARGQVARRPRACPLIEPSNASGRPYCEVPPQEVLVAALTGTCCHESGGTNVRLEEGLRFTQSDTRRQQNLFGRCAQAIALRSVEPARPSWGAACASVVWPRPTAPPGWLQAGPARKLPFAESGRCASDPSLCSS